MTIDPNYKPPPPPRSTRGVLFEFLVGHTRWLCELMTHPNGATEAQFFRNEEFNHSRNFAPGLSNTRTTRDLAIAWAEEERRALEKGGA